MKDSCEGVSDLIREGGRWGKKGPGQGKKDIERSNNRNQRIPEQGTENVRYKVKKKVKELYTLWSVQG